MEEELLKPYRESEEIRQALLAKYPALPIKKVTFILYID